MKKLALFVSAVIMVFAFAACGSSSSPKDVANAYYTALQKGDYEKAMSYTTLTDSEEIQASIKKMQGLEYKISEFEILNEEIAEDGNSATVEVKYTYTLSTRKNPKEKTDTLKLIKEDGKWKIKE